MKWYTYNIYVDQQTGEIITRNKAEREYIIIKKIKKHEKKYRWLRANNNGTKLREEYGETTITNICTKQGRQITIW